GRGQAVVENLVEGILELTTGIVGNKVAKHTFPLLVALFTYILVQNWSGLFPGVGTIFYRGEEIVRPGNADLNGTIALSVVAIAGKNPPTRIYRRERAQCAHGGHPTNQIPTT